MKRVVIGYIDAGEGHRAAAIALKEVIRSQKRPWQVELVNVDELLQPADVTFWLLGVRTNYVYNWLIGRDLIVGTRQLLPIVHLLFRAFHPIMMHLFGRCWKRLDPDLVVSVTPHRNRALYESLRKVDPDVPFVTILTDLADYPPRFWIERREQQQHYICGTSMALEQARRMAAPPNRVWPASGMVVHPKFYATHSIDRGSERRKLGLDPDLPTGLVLWGGYGSRSVVKIARSLGKTGMRLQTIFLCGRNAALVRKLQSMRFPYPAHVHGFTDDVLHYMALSDFLIGKPGPGGISEALVMGLPLIVQDSWKTMVHERFNVQWIRENGVGVSFKRMRDLPRAVEQLLQPAAYSAMRQRIEALNNRAVFEIPDILEQILAASSPSGPPEIDERRMADNTYAG